MGGRNTSGSSQVRQWLQAHAAAYLNPKLFFASTATDDVIPLPIYQGRASDALRTRFLVTQKVVDVLSAIRKLVSRSVNSRSACRDSRFPATLMLSLALSLDASAQRSDKSLEHPTTDQAKEDLAAELEANALQQGRDFLTEEYRKRIGGYLPNHYAS